jgi:hypothetical protein
MRVFEPSRALAKCLTELVTVNAEHKMIAQGQLKALGFDCETSTDGEICRLIVREQYYSIGPLYTRGKPTKFIRSFVALTSVYGHIKNLRVLQEFSDVRNNDSVIASSENLIQTYDLNLSYPGVVNKIR